MILISLFGGLLACVLLLPACSDLLSLVRIRLGVAPEPGRTPARPTRFLFLVPAHNEELLIGDCLASLERLNYPRSAFAVCVIADNCSDRTAELSRAAGVACLVRVDPALPGKPHAIAWALQQLSLQDYDAVVILDADTTVNAEFAAACAAAAPLGDQVVQPFNGVGNPDETALTRMARVLATAYRCAAALKNRAGLNVPLGAGMCLGARVLATHGWRAFSICEDWELYARLTTRGVRISGVPAARLLAQEARSLRQAASQRRRWMAGKLTVLARCAGPLIGSRRIGFAQKLDSIAELTTVGPAVHLGLATFLTAAALALGLPGATLLMVAAAASLVRPLIYAGTALRIDPDPRRALLAFGFLPIYTVWRCGVAIASLAMLGDRPWVRTARHSPGRASGAHESARE